MVRTSGDSFRRNLTEEHLSLLNAGLGGLTLDGTFEERGHQGEKIFG